MSFLLDAALIISCIIIFALGFTTGLTRSFFAVAAGFIGIMAASKYPYQSGINYYIIFAAASLLVMLCGVILQRIIKFFYLTILDKTAGAALGVFVWVLVALNVILPSINHASAFVEQSRLSISRVGIKTMHNFLPHFGSYAISGIRREVSKKMNDIIENKNGDL
jgi:uncharacterized membrane protein required for colicin V production